MKTSEYFKEGEHSIGYVSSNFLTFVPNNFEKGIIPGFKTLERNMSDSEIKSELGAEECTLGDVVAFLDNPPEGTKDGYWNIFYVAGCVVDVHWRSGNREWGVVAWKLDGDYWGAGNRACGRNWSLETEKESLDTLSLDTLTRRVELPEQIIGHHHLGL